MILSIEFDNHITGSQLSIYFYTVILGLWSLNKIFDILYSNDHIFLEQCFKLYVFCVLDVPEEAGKT